MKKLIATAGLLVCFGVAFAGGLLTNGNQSAQYIRMLSRNASTTVDAVYFNPAGLMLMDNGFYIAIQNQSIVQSKTVESYYPLLNSSTYDGAVKAPLFPTAYAVYKLDKVAFSLGVGPNSGGGSAEFGHGLPSFEKSISQLVPGLAGLNQIGQSISGYNADIYFKGESVYWGIQGGVSFKVNDKISLYGGLRYVPASNKYTGHINNIQVKANGVFKTASSYLSGEVAPIFTGLAAQATAGAAGVQPLISAGAGAYNLSTLQGAGYITTAQRTQIESGLLGLGVTQAQINVMSVNTIQSTFNSTAAMLNSNAATMVATAASLTDKAVDVNQTGSGVTPILGVNLSLCEGLNIGMKYEFMTKLTLTNATKVDGTGMFPDKAKTSSDIPAIFSVGVDYKLTKNLLLSTSFNHYYDKGVDWGNNIYNQPRVMQKNGREYALGGQYQLCKKVAVSVGYLRTIMGVYEQFNSDFSYYSNSNTFSGGFELKPTSRLTVDLGALFTNYDNAPKLMSDPSVGNYYEIYKKHNVCYAVGLAYHFGGK